MSAQQHQSNSERGPQPYPTQPYPTQPYPPQARPPDAPQPPPPQPPSPQPLPPRQPRQPGQPQAQPYSAQAYPQQPQQPPWQYPPPYPPPYPPQPYYFERKRGTGQAKRVFLAAVTPWTAARFLLKPKTGERIRDRKLTLLASSRAVLAALVVVLATVNFRNPRETLSGSWDTFAYSWLPAALFTPVLFVVLLAVTRSGHRTELLPGALRLLWRLLLGVVCIALPLLVLWLAGAGMEPAADDHALSFSIEVLLVYAWLPLFGACAVYWGSRSGLWLGELHPLLGPIGSTSLMLLISGHVMVEVGLSWWLALICCGVVGTLVLAVFEVGRARLIGCRFRGGPEPVRVVLPEPEPAVSDSGVALSETPVLPRGLRDPDRRRPFWVRAEAFPKIVAAAEGSPGRWDRLRGIAATIGNVVSVRFRPVAALFAAGGRGVAKPFAPIVRFVRRKRGARGNFGTKRPTAVGQPNRGGPGFAVVVFPWSTARYLFKPEVGSQSRDRLLDRLGFWRAVAGLAVVVLTTIQYQWSDLLWDLTGKGVSTIELGVFVGVPAAILMAIDARQYGYGPKLRQGLLSVVKRAGLGLFVAIPLPLGIVVGIVAALVLAFTTPVGLLVVPMIPLGVVALLWCVPFLVCTFYWAVRSCLWISEVNPLLAPVATTVFAAAISIEEIAIATTTATDATNGVPIDLWLSLNIFGLITTVLLGTAEFQHARSLGYWFLRGRETVPVAADPPQPSSAIFRPVARDLSRLARDHYRHVRNTDR